MKTSVLLEQNIRTFAQRSPMFCTFRLAVSLYPPQKKFGSASIWVIDMFLHGSSICLIINILTSKKVVDVRIFLYLCM